jgi:hypothetical protein
MLSPILPPRDHLPDFVSKMINWDYRGFSWDATGGQAGGQVEGYNYLGIGLIFLAVVQLTAWKSTASAIKRNAFLTAVFVGLFLYALSNRIYIGDWLAVEIPLSESLSKTIGLFRTSGRMFWPFYYFLAIAVVFGTAKRFEPKTARRLVFFALILQLLDTASISEATSRKIAVGFPQPLKREAWEPLIAGHKFLAQYPPFQCGGLTKGGSTNTNLELLLIAAEQGLASNSVYLSRPNTHACRKDTAEGLSFDIRDGGLYIFSGIFPIDQLESKPDFKSLCREFALGTARGLVCTRSWDRVIGPEIDSTFLHITKLGFHPYDLGDELNFGEGGNGLRYLKEGWSQIGPSQIWSFQEKSSLQLQLPAQTVGPLKVIMTSLNFVNDSQPFSAFMVSVNGVNVSRLNYSAGEPTKVNSFEIPKNIVENSKHQLNFTFAWQPDAAPDQANIPLVSRLKGISLYNMKVQKVE